ncbi:hypothetical protein [Prochlorococcus marinus]|nr:hypothetical protein [Prochlorococcus marinus]
MPVLAKATSTKSNVSVQSRFATSKLIQNLGSNPEQYNFNENLRTVYGRD